MFFFSSVQFSHSVMSDSLRPHESQHARPPCPSPTPGVHWDSRPLSQWCHPAISSSVVPFPSCLQSLPASESFPMSQLFAWGGQSTGVSASASFLPKKCQSTGLCPKRTYIFFLFIHWYYLREEGWSCPSPDIYLRDSASHSNLIYFHVFLFCFVFFPDRKLIWWTWATEKAWWLTHTCQYEGRIVFARKVECSFFW